MVVSSILNAAVHEGLLRVESGQGGFRTARQPAGEDQKAASQRKAVDGLVRNLKEPYATMVIVVAYTGLRISELLALRWENVGPRSITVDQRYRR